MAKVTKVRVTVTFMRMDRRPVEAAPRLPADMQIALVQRPTVSFYRFLYNTVGADYLWWLNRVLPDSDLARLLDDPAVTIHVLLHQDRVGGFFQLDRSNWPDINLSYFGLMPHMIGQGVGRAFLRAAVDQVWNEGARGMTVNTCTADHPRALPNYLRTGFDVTRQVDETWAIPDSLGMRIPAGVRI